MTAASFQPPITPVSELNISGGRHVALLKFLFTRQTSALPLLPASSSVSLACSRKSSTSNVPPRTSRSWRLSWRKVSLVVSRVFAAHPELCMAPDSTRRKICTQSPPHPPESTQAKGHPASIRPGVADKGPRGAA
jgi:hypothetical protein